MTLQGIVTKCVGGVFTVNNASTEYTCFSPKKFRQNDGDLLVGDKVSFEVIGEGKGNIVSILPRKNKLKRPEIANIDVAFVVVAVKPEPDLLLVDKVLVNCFKQGIKPVIVVNKCDIDESIFARIKANYGAVCDVVLVSAFSNKCIETLSSYINGNVVCFAGQSAVGKTSLLNLLLQENVGETGELSEKSGRGKNTTRHSNMHQIYGGYVVDTCGFSLCELDEIESADLKYYYDEFTSFNSNCKFNSCMHISEPNCAVKQAVENGLINHERYERYVVIYNELKQQEKNKY